MADTAVNVKPDGPPPFRFLPLLSEIHRMVVSLPGYGLFFFKYFLLQLVRLATALSFVVAVFIMGDKLDTDNITNGQYVVFGLIGLLNIVGRLTPFLNKLIIDHMKENLQAEQATAIVAKIFELPHDAMVSTPTGQFIQLIQKVYRNLDTLMPALYGGIFPVALEVFTAVIFIGVAYGPIALVQLALFVVYTLVAYRAAAGKAQRNRDMMMALMGEWGKIMDVANSYERAHLFNNIDREINNARNSFATMGSKITRVFSGEHREGMAMMAISLISTVLFLIVLPEATDDVEGVERAALALYFIIFIGSLDQYALGVSNLRTSVFEYQAFDAFLSSLSDVADAEDAIVLPKNKNPTIEFSHVSFSYGGKTILDDVSFRLEGGETLGLTGASGCGKSTIIRLLLRFYKLSSGTITVDGHDITRVTGRSLRDLFSSVTQDAQLVNATIRENIAYGKLGATDDEILAAARLAELDVNTEGSDLTLDKVCGEKGAKLSGGQQQRVSLARAMLKKGTIYLLDEPTTGLDGTTAKQLQATFDELTTAGNATTITITHHLDDLKRAHQILYLENGRIVERGTFDDLMAVEDGKFASQVQARHRGPPGNEAPASAGEAKEAEVSGATPP